MEVFTVQYTMTDCYSGEVFAWSQSGRNALAWLWYQARHHNHVFLVHSTVLDVL